MRISDWSSDVCSSDLDNRKPWTNPGYTSLDEGAARFRLRPEQRCDNDYLLAFIARRSLVLRDDRWHWCFDPDADRSRGVPFSGHSGDVIAAAQCPLDFLWGDRSSLEIGRASCRERVCQYV